NPSSSWTDWKSVLRSPPSEPADEQYGQGNESDQRRPADRAGGEDDGAVEDDEDHEPVQQTVEPEGAKRVAPGPQPPPGDAQRPEQREQVRDVDALADAAAGARVLEGVGVRPAVDEVEGQADVDHVDGPGPRPGPAGKASSPLPRRPFVRSQQQHQRGG